MLILTPKSGCGSLHQFLRSCHNLWIPWTHDIGIMQVLHRFPQIDHVYVPLRDPAERLISQYQWTKVLNASQRRPGATGTVVERDHNWTLAGAPLLTSPMAKGESRWRSYASYFRGVALNDSRVHGVCFDMIEPAARNIYAELCPTAAPRMPSFPHVHRTNDKPKSEYPMTDELRQALHAAFPAEKTIYDYFCGRANQPVTTTTTQGKALQQSAAVAVAPRPEADVAARRPIALLTWSNRMHRFAPVEQIVGAYCAKHGYDRLVSHTRRVPQLAASWEKVPFLIEMLPRYEAILQLDDDAVINQIDTRVETFLDANPEFDMLMTAVEKGGRRRKGSPVMGFFIMRHTPQIMNLLTRLLEDPACTARTRSKCCWEQDCFWQLLTNHASVWSDYTFRLFIHECVVVWPCLHPDPRRVADRCARA